MTTKCGGGLDRRARLGKDDDPMMIEPINSRLLWAKYSIR
jgi:hypothetical protein